MERGQLLRCAVRTRPLTSAVDDTLLAAYRGTEYRFVADQALLILRIGQPNPAVDALVEPLEGDGLAFITNFNPRGERYSDKANGQRNEALQRWLLRKGLPHWIGMGVPPASEDWQPETSFAIGGLRENEATRVAMECEQRAYVWHPAGRQTQLVLCSP